MHKKSGKQARPRDITIIANSATELWALNNREALTFRLASVGGHELGSQTLKILCTSMSVVSTWRPDSIPGHRVI